MEEKLIKKKIERKKFFKTIGTGFIGLTVFNSFPFSLFGKKDSKKTGKIKVSINPLSVQRKNSGGSNV